MMLRFELDSLLSLPVLLTTILSVAGLLLAAFFHLKSAKEAEVIQGQMEWIIHRSPKSQGDSQITYAGFAIDVQHRSDVEKLLVEGDYKSVLRRYQKILLEEISKNSNRLRISYVYEGIATAYTKLGYYESAIDFYKKSLKFRSRLWRIKKLYSTASIISNIATIEEIYGNYELALKGHKKALKVREKRLGKQHQETARSYENIGRVLFKKIESGRKVKSYATSSSESRYKCNKIDERTDSIESPSRYESQIIKKEKLALEYHSKALNIFRKVLGNYSIDCVRVCCK